ncbi:MAG TPA: ParB/RepB/Spo0J family partition protein [Thermomicrobiales bacterium]|nr:ParB/RepB/Spo0J family partition protein [Thermomicrobiales bacterium]
MSSVAPATSGKSGSRRRFTVDALFTDGRPQAVGVSDLPTAKEIRLDRIVPDPAQPRRSFDPVRLEELATSITLEGVLQPIVVRYDEADDIYVIVHGERRWRASREAGQKTIPAIVRDVDEEHRLIQQLMENVVREDLNAVDRAQALRALKQQMTDASWESVAAAVGIRRSRLFQLLGTEKLPDTIQDDIRTGRLSEKQSRALQGLSADAQLALRDSIVADDLSVDETIRLARALKSAEMQPGALPPVVLLAELRRQQSPPPPEIDTTTLLTAIAAAATGNAADRQQLVAIADAAWAASFDPERLDFQVAALARSLARLPTAELRFGHPVHTLLTQLQHTLDTLLAR